MSACSFRSQLSRNKTLISAHRFWSHLSNSSQKKSKPLDFITNHPKTSSYSGGSLKEEGSGMGQALRRATARVRSSSLDPSSSSQVKKVEKRPQAAPTVEPRTISKRGEGGADGLDPGGISRTATDNMLEERDRGYDAMLSQMVGRIRSKPGGKPEMGQAFIVEKYNRPMPKLRNTKPESSRYEERPVPPGTLNVAQLRQIFLLHQGKGEDHDGPMDAHQIAEKFRVNVVQVQKILQFLSLPPEDSSSRQKD